MHIHSSSEYDYGLPRLHWAGKKKSSSKDSKAGSVVLLLFNKEAISYADMFLKLRLKMHYPGDAQSFVMATLCPDEY